MWAKALLFTVLITSAAASAARAQTSVDSRGAGAIIAGYDSRSCSASLEGAIRYNSATSKAETCVSMAAAAPTGCANIGNVCSDGSVYAGLSPDGNVRMYTTPADAGSFAWNNANNTGYTITGQTSYITGQANTEALNGLDANSAVGGMQPHRAAQHCANLIAHDRSDWYLPAVDELNVLWVNRAAIGGFNLSGSSPAGWYWTSSESSDSSARGQRFSDGAQANNFKISGLTVRCVRKLSIFYNWKSWGW